DRIAALGNALDQRFRLRLQVDDQIGNDGLGFQVRIDLLVQGEFVVRQIQLREQRVLVEQEVGDRRAAEQVRLRQRPDLVDALEEEVELRRQRIARHVPIELR